MIYDKLMSYDRYYKKSILFIYFTTIHSKFLSKCVYFKLIVICFLLCSLIYNHYSESSKKYK